VLWLPLQVGIELGFGLARGGSASAPWGVLAAALALACAPAPRRALAVAAWLALAAAGTGAVLALRVPARTPDAPGVASLRHVEDARERSARWLALTQGAPLPAPLQALHPFERAPRPYEWLPFYGGGYAAPAPALGAPAPELAVLASALEEGVRRVRVRLDSRRDAPRLLLRLPPAARATSIRWRGREVAGHEPRGGSLAFCGFAPGELELDLALATTEPVAIGVADATYALPPAAAPLRAARPDDHVPFGEGDASIVGHLVEL
jgi:hypothetical protein